MSKLTIGLLALVIVALVLGGVGLAAAYFETKTLQGTVVSSQGEPIAGAAVTVGGNSAMSDERGYFQVQFPRGTWQVPAFADGFQATTDAISAEEWTELNYSAQLTLEPRIWRAQVIAGDTRKPLMNVPVQYEETALKTDGNGILSVGGVKNGAKLRIAQPGYRAVTVTVQAPGNDDAPTLISLEPSQTTVKVLDQVTTQPMAGVPVTAGGKTVTSDTNGQVIFMGLEPMAAVSAQAPGYAVSNAPIDGDGELTLELVPTLLTGHTLNAATQTSVANALLLRGGDDGSLAPLGQTDAQGQFVLEDFSQVPTLYVKKTGLPARQIRSDAWRQAGFFAHAVQRQGHSPPLRHQRGGCREHHRAVSRHRDERRSV